MTNDASRAKTPPPWATLALIVANLLAAALVTVAPDLAFDFAFHPRNPQFANALASVFLHANTVHLLGNMVFLAAVGPQVEATAGRVAYLGVYLFGGFVGVAAHWALMSSVPADTPLLGASGAIAACVGYCAVRFMGKKVPLAPGLSVSVGAVSLIWLVLQAAGFFIKFGETASGPAYWSHVAGFLAGLLTSVLLGAPHHAKVQHGHDLLDKMGGRSPGALLRAAQDHLKQHPDDPRALRELAQALHLMGDHDQEAQTLVKLSSVVKPAEQVSVLRELMGIGGLRELSPVARSKTASLLVRTDAELARALLRSVVTDPQAEEQRADALVDLISLTEGQERDQLRQELESQYPLHPATALARSRGLLG